MKSRLLIIMCAFIYMKPSISAPVQFYNVPYQVIDVFSILDVGYNLSNGLSNSLSQEDRGGLTTSLDTTYNLDLLYGTQATTITASPTIGTVTGQGSSTTNLLPMNGAFRSWADSIVVGKFIVPIPEVVTGLGDIIYEFSGISSSNYFGPLFTEESTLLGNPSNILDGDRIPNTSPQLNSTRIVSYIPGDVVYFAFGIETGISGGGDFINGLTDSDNISATLAIKSLVKPSVVPVPAAVWLFGSGLLGLISIARKKKI